MAASEMPKTWKEALTRLTGLGSTMRMYQSAYFQAVRAKDMINRDRYLKLSKHAEAEYDAFGKLVKYYLDNNLLSNDDDKTT